MTERYKERQKKKPPPYKKRPGQQPIVDFSLTVTPPPRPPSKPRPKPDPSIFDPIYTHTQQYSYPYPSRFVWPPVYPPKVIINKEYKINTTDPLNDHGRVNMIYEDVLPSSQFSDTSNTLEERVNILNYVRSKFIKQNDGENIGLDDSNNNSIARFVKYGKLNPYNTYRYSNNPYKGLPDNMLIYSSCYPVRYDRTINTTLCAANSLGMNIRIYRLTLGEYNVKSDKKRNYYDYNLWREVFFYEYIRERILKQLVCPNFVMLFGYFVCEKCDIDFNKIIRLKGKKTDAPGKYIVEDDRTGLKKVVNEIKSFYNASVKIDKTKDYGSINDILVKAPITVELNNDTYINKCLLAITESPTYNLYTWASSTYEIHGNIKKQITDGYHKNNVWMSVLFQIMVALYVLQINKIAFINFDVPSNIYIKDISTHGNITRYWKYIIDGVGYYIPNHGFLVMIDSSYKDIDKSGFSLGSSQKSIYKIYSNIFANDSKQSYNDTRLNEMCFGAFRKSINTNAFSNAFTNIGGTKPPEDVLKLMDNIQQEISKTNSSINIGEYIVDFMGQFMNNRIGTFLNEYEINNVNRNTGTLYKKGQMIVYPESNDTYKFALFYKKNETGAIIYTRTEPSNKTIIRRVIPYSSVLHYSQSDKIIQDFKPNIASLNEDDLLETYIIHS